MFIFNNVFVNIYYFFNYTHIYMETTTCLIKRKFNSVNKCKMLSKM